MTKYKPSDKFWNKVAAKYSKSPVSDEKSYQFKLGYSQKYMQPHMNLLELGCGTGSTAMVHAPHVRHILATDLSENMLDIAKEKAQKKGVENISFEKGSVEELDLDSQSFDLVLCMSLLHLLKDKEAALKKIHHALREGGTFISSTICLAEMMNPVKYFLPLGHKLGFLPLVKSFSQNQLIDSIKNAGFTVEFHWQPKKGAAVFIVARKPASC